jgi:hypothetical protein
MQRMTAMRTTGMSARKDKVEALEVYGPVAQTHMTTKT